jgi:hypothetical protein
MASADIERFDRPGASSTEPLETSDGLRDARFPLAEPFVFAHEFAQAYCGLTAVRVRAAKDFLQRAGVTYRAGLHGSRR